MAGKAVIDDPSLLLVLLRFRRSGQMKLLPKEPLPVPSGFRVISKTDFGNGTEFVLGWIDPEEFSAEISGYTIYAIGRKNNSIVTTVDTDKSPVRVSIGAPDDELVTFVLETRYKGGYQAGPEHWVAVTDTAARPAQGGGDDYISKPSEVSPALRVLFSVSSMPPSNDSEFSVGQYVINTSNGRIYKKTASGWVEQTIADYIRTIQGSDIVNQAITSSKIASAAINATHIGAGVINASHIGTGVINGSHIGAGVITGGHIANATITGNNIQNGTISGGHIAAGSIFADHIASGQINATHIGTGVINGTHIGTGVITGSHIASATITGGNIASGTITGDRIATGTITAANIANGTITASKIAAGTITANEISNLTITTDKIGTLNLNASQISTIYGSKVDSTAPDRIMSNVMVAGHLDVRNSPFNPGSGTVYCAAVSAYNWGVNDSGHATFQSGQAYSWNVINSNGLVVGGNTVNDAAFRSVGVGANQVTPKEHKHTVTVNLGQYTNNIYYLDWNGDPQVMTVVTGVYVASVVCSDAIAA